MNKKRIIGILTGFSMILLPLFLFSQDLDYVHTVIKKLASPEMDGRGYVDHGERKAAGFIADQFKNFDLKHLGSDYFQYFDMPVNSFPDGLALQIDKQVMVPGKDYIIGPGSPAIKGIFDSFPLPINKFSDLSDLFTYLKKNHDKIALVDYAEIQSDSIRKMISDFESFIRHDTIIGLTALALVNYQPLQWSVSTVVDTTPVIYINSSLDIVDVHRISLRIVNHFNPAYKTRNIIGFLPGLSEKDTFVVITAHYDHLGRMGKKTYFPGANDNASGTALMLDLARSFSEDSVKQKYSLLFIAFGGEEAGLLGSVYFVNHPLIQLERIKFLINLDLAGTGDEGIRVVNGTEYPDKFNFLKNFNETHNLLPAVRSRGKACNSDHCPFYLHKVKCFYIYTLGGIKAYHDIYDRFSTLPLTAYNGYFVLLDSFIRHLNE